VQQARAKPIWASVQTITSALIYGLKHRSNPPKEWLAPRDIWESVPRYRGHNLKKKFQANVVRLAYHIEKRYSKTNLFGWEELSQSPGWIADRLLRSIGIRAKGGVSNTHDRVKHRYRRATHVYGVPIPPGPEYDAIRTMVPKYYRSQNLKISEKLEADILRKAGEDQPGLVQGFETSSGMSRPEVPPYYRRAPQIKEGDLCPNCLCKYKWYRTGVLIRGNEILENQTNYYKCWRDAESGGYTALRLLARWGDLATPHRQRVAQARYESEHTLKCACGDDNEDDADWSEFNIPGGLNFNF